MNSYFKPKPMFSIITTVLNGEKSIEKTIKSVLKQKYKNFEYIIIDGGSKDNTMNIIKKYKNKISKVLSSKDRGIYDGFNKGMKLSSGSYICFINSADEFFPNSLKIISNYCNKDSSLDFIFGGVKKHYGLLYGYNKKKINWSWNFYSSHSTGFFIKSSSAKKVGYYNLKYKYCSDYDYFYRMIVKHKLKGASTKKSEVVGKFAPGGFSTKINRFDLFIEEVKIRLDNNQKIFFILLFISNKIINNPILLIKSLLQKFKIIN
jgi:glycosyltransferase involved in cell wall biosynthesis